MLLYYALAFSLLIIPAFYVCTFSQDENIGFKNYYIIYLGLIIFPLLFIRDFRSITTFTIDPVDAKDFDDAISVEFF